MADPIQVQPFGVKFDQAIQFLKNKTPEGTLKWDDLAGPVHAKVFTFAGGASVSLIGDIQKSLVGALENGTTLSQFRKDWDAAVQKHGWTYKGKRGWRTALIFNNAMRQAHMAGRWEQLQANKDRRPFVQYRTAGDARVRPLHRQWNGLVFRLDDPVLQKIYPPNGLNCRCTVRAYSQADLDNNGLKPEANYELKYRDVLDKEGKLKDRVPVGVDPGFDYNVGQAWIAPEVALGQKIAALPTKELKGLFAEKSVSPAFQKVLNERWNGFYKTFSNSNRREPAMQIVGYMDATTLAAVAEQVPQLTIKNTSIAVADFKRAHLSGQKKAKDSPKQVWPDDWQAKLPEHLRNYRAIFWDNKEPGLMVIPSDAFNDWIPYILLMPTQASEGLTWKQPAVTSLGARPHWNENITIAGVKKERYTLLVGKRP
jgi:SPP1 gp7 family putative phage head morphogenesis protein